MSDDLYTTQHAEPAPPVDEVEGRTGSWMQTSLGGKFFPLDPKPEDIHISDIANGLALDIRYGGQGRVDRLYTVAEHCYHVAFHAAFVLKWEPRPVLAVLLHDAAEGYINDMPAAVKHSIRALGQGYDALEASIQTVINEKYGVTAVAQEWHAQIKELDDRIVPLEKAAIMRHPQPWAHDQYEPLSGVVIRCWRPETAKQQFLAMYRALCHDLDMETEEYEI